MASSTGPDGYPLARIDAAAYASEVLDANRARQCFICEIVRSERSVEHLVYRDDVCVAFFPRWPRLVGYTLLAPLEHRTAVIGDFSEAEYAELHLRIHRVGRAVMGVVPTERLYLFSLGSNDGIDHVHWHIAPLPPGVPYDEQQFAAVAREEYLEIPDVDQRDLAARMAGALTD
jgi:histidine triad (HIT) family protein